MVRGGWCSMGEPVWSLATLFPPQGTWSEDEYLGFAAEHPRVELSDGYIDVLPAPTDLHQRLLGALFLVLHAYAAARGGVVRMAGIRVRLRAGKIREPDLAYLAPEHA